jgi:hypothetical protein
MSAAILSKLFKPVGWAKPSLARSDSTSMGGKTGEKGRGLRRQTPFGRLGSCALRSFGLFGCRGPRRFWLGLSGSLLDSLRFLFRGKLRFDLLGNGVGVHLVVLGGVFERLTSLRLRPG